MFENNNLLKYFSEEELIDLLIMDDLYNKAYIIVSRLFEGKKDKSGNPYIRHLIRVASKLEDEYERVAGLLHDTLEDTEVRCSDLFDVGFPLEILEIVVIVTKNDVDTRGMSEEEKLELYESEIDDILNSGNIHAIRLKESDMSDNYDSNRLNKLPEDLQVWFHKKYGNNLGRIRKRLREEN